MRTYIWKEAASRNKCVQIGRDHGITISDRVGPGLQAHVIDDEELGAVRQWSTGGVCVGVRRGDV